MRIFSSWKEKGLILLALASFIALLISAYRLELWSFLDGTNVGEFLVAKGTGDFVFQVSGGIVSAYIFYVLIDLVPRARREASAFAVLDSLVSAILEGLLEGSAFQHEKGILAVDYSLSRKKEGLVTLAEELENFKIGYLKLKSAAQTADTRYEDFKSVLLLAASISPPHARVWLALTEKVRLLKEQLEKKPQDFDFSVSLESSGAGPEDLSHNPSKLYLHGLYFRATEFLELCIEWRNSTSGRV
ncbi:TPA: hypothetical protein NIH23_000209 [Pseudomonas aeruginosa]|nr:hypothetical protein [Pseudomonas aeruginosa]HCF5878459.1 hypothetical protein [Pseudomonas aeruginosa]